MDGRPGAARRGGPRGGALAAALLVAALLVAACAPEGPAAPVTPDMPPVGEDAGLPHPAEHWAGAMGTCTTTTPARLFGLVPPRPRLLRVRILSREAPFKVEVQRIDGAGENFHDQTGFLVGSGEQARVVVYLGQDGDGRDRVLAWAGVDRQFHFPGEACREGSTAPQHRPLPTTAAATTSAAPAPPPAAPLRPPSEVERFAGGRTEAWWRERLTALRRGGPPDLYALARDRAAAAGLTVTEGPDGAVTATLPEAR